MGLAASAAGGMLLALVVAIATVKFHTEHMVSGLAVNILALGLTSFMLRAMVGGGQAPVIRVATLQASPVPYLSDLPLVGTLLFRQPPLTYLAFLMIVPMALFLFRTRAGLTLRDTVTGAAFALEEMMDQYIHLRQQARDTSVHAPPSAGARCARDG